MEPHQPLDTSVRRRRGPPRYPSPSPTKSRLSPSGSSTCTQWPVSSRWRFNLDGVEALLRDYAVTDCWPWLLSLGRRARVDVVQAGRDPRWTPEELGRFAGVQRLNLHRLETGHWVHVEDPEGLNRLLVGEGLG